MPVDVFFQKFPDAASGCEPSRSMILRHAVPRRDRDVRLRYHSLAVHFAYVYVMNGTTNGLLSAFREGVVLHATAI